MRVQHRLFAPGGVILVGCWMVVFGASALEILSFGGCTSSNPVAAANDTPQRAYALYGTFVIVEEQAARLIQDPGVAPSIKSAIRVADSRAKPSADALANALREYEAAAAALKAGTTTADKVTIATSNMSIWIAQARSTIEALVNAVASAAANPAAT